MFSVAQLEPAPDPAEDPFQRPRPQQPPSVFMEGDTDKHKSFEIDRLLNKRTIRKGRGLAVEYLVRWTEYGPEWDRWYNIKDLDNAAELVQAYERGLTQRGRWGFSCGGGDCHGFIPILPLFFLFAFLLNLMPLYCKTQIGLVRSPDRI